MERRSDTREAVRNLIKAVEGLTDSVSTYRPSLEAIYGRLLAISDRLEALEGKTDILCSLVGEDWDERGSDLHIGH